MALICITDDPYQRDFYHYVLRGHCEGYDIPVDEGFEWNIEGGVTKSISIGYPKNPFWFELGNNPDYLSSRKTYLFRAWTTYYVSGELVTIRGEVKKFNSSVPVCTGFSNAFIKKPLNKYYSYHGILMPCNIQPEPGTFICCDTKPPGGPIVTVTYSASMKGNFDKSDFDYLLVHNAVESGFYGPYLGQKREDFGGGLYLFDIFRIVLAWDTINLPNDCTILNAKIMATLTDNWSGFIFSIVVRNGMPLYPHIPVERRDYNFAIYSGYGGSAEITNPGPWELVFDEVGRSWINKEGYSKFILMSDRDFVSQEPVANDTIGFMDMLQFWKLEVTYQEAV